MQLSPLATLLDRPGPWASVYADLAQTDESGAKQRELSVREACRALAEEGADAATVEAVRQALTGAAEAEEPGGHVVFAAGGEVTFSRRLARPPQRQNACWAPLPRLTPLLELVDQDPVCLVAYIDRTGADFELRHTGGVREAGAVEGRQWPVHRTASADWSERHFQLKVENTWDHNAGEIAAALSTAFEESGADLVLLVGDPRERPAVRERLPETVRRVAVETEHGGRAPGSGSPALDEAIEAARRQYTRRRAEEALDRFRAGRVGTDRATDAVEGVPALVEAAREHRIGTLLLRPGGADLSRETWVGAEPDQLAVRRTDVQALGERDPVPARADDALVRAAAAASAEVLILPSEGAEGAEGSEDSVEGMAADVPVGGLGALLRWTNEAPDTGSAR
ncbi:Vms1/Ankzf1 family peptidyl-tRNA hydrolase [Streptomyces sp. NBC_00237]|uniref:baeRF2 domain-containing protein n=1 Tax=Streptomyces sp. NBC_00237 TaxID=2975687 RepID=UPI0022560385|nr:Vms1/Ankzf1 family peptidyl-tRNA hydrolase [Streptomyces sp. NBC_00237]MCX5205546.1 Vms1/Ankzf1 family peptidyl-tRNA hydrolase [Streptomyces sp. NBC_00237]